MNISWSDLLTSDMLPFRLCCAPGGCGGVVRRQRQWQTQRVARAAPAAARFDLEASSMVLRNGPRNGETQTFDDARREWLEQLRQLLRRNCRSFDDDENLVGRALRRDADAGRVRDAA